MNSPLEENPKILEKIGLFIVLFNGIESSIELEFFYIINQNNSQTKPILDFLCSQPISIKNNLLEKLIGHSLFIEIQEINDFRNYIGHGLYGKNSLGQISNTKKNRKGKYTSIDLSEEKLDNYIGRERAILNKLHELRLKKMKK